MNSTLKVVGPIILVILVVFGATLISQYTPPEKKAGGEGAQIVGQPLEFRATEMAYNPNAEDVAARAFDAFHEPGGGPVYVSFWFKNPHTVPVRLRVTGRSCSSCTAASAAIVPNDAIDALTRQAAVGLFPPSALPVPDLLTPLAAVALDRKLDWQPLDFDNTEQGVQVPAAVDADTPTLGIFRTHVTVNSEGPKSLRADIGMAVGEQPSTNLAFKVTVVGVAPFYIHPKEVKLGDLPEGSPPRAIDVHYWSTTRGPAELPPPHVAAATQDRFLQAGAPVPLSPDEAARLAVRLAGEGVATRVAAAYRVPVTVHRHLPTSAASGGPTEPDVGAFERRVGFAGPNGSSATLAVTGTVTGAVALDGVGQVALGSFNARAGTKKAVAVVSDRGDLALDVLPGEHHPGFLRAELGEPKAEAGRRYWPLTVVVPAGAGSGPLPADAHVALRATGPNRNQKVRFPVTGQGVTR